MPFIVAAYSATALDVTTFSPNFLMFGRDICMPMDLANGFVGTEQRSQNDYAQHVCERLAEAHEMVRLHVNAKAADMKHQYGRVVM